MASPTLAVILGGRLLGRVERTRAGVLRFTYGDDPGSTPLSLSMPIVEGTFADERVRRFLDALLPESGAARTAIGRRYPDVDPRDPLSMLAVIGKDCPGAVQFCPVDDVGPTLEREGSLIPVSVSEIEAHLSELRIDEGASWTMKEDHWSLGGTQAKFALRRVGAEWFEPQGAQPTSHIIKPGIHGLSHQALVEHVTMRTADACGLDVATSEYVDFKSERAIAVTRFDRFDEGGALRRLHQEDLCQALGVQEKYEEHGGVSAGNVIRLLRDTSRTRTDALANVSRFVRAVIFNTVMAAPDAHARNYAVILDGDSVKLAPVFDAATSLTYGAPASGSRTVSMSVGGQFHVDRIGAHQWARFADANDLDAVDIIDTVHEFAELAVPAMSVALEEVDDWDGSVAEIRARLIPALSTRMREVEGLLKTA